jgi:PIN domain nuclease of toxin-antitoxin system
MGRKSLMVLDTCAVIWLAFDRQKLSEHSLNQIDRSDNILISTMSFWEIGVKINKKKLSIPITFHELVRLYAENENVRLVAPDVDIVIKSLDLKWEHKDPVDRIIVSTAWKYDDCIVTADSHIEKFYKKTIGR